MLTITLQGPRPGSGDNWHVEARNTAGMIVLHAFGARDVVLAALAEFVEEMHKWG